MKGFRYFMPANTYFGKRCIAENKEALRPFGEKALIVTGRNSAKKNGSQADITAALEQLGKTWVLFDEIEENPSLETVCKGAALGKAEGVSFVIGIGGGSPMDSAKAIACLIANPEKDSSVLFGPPAAHLPVVEIPTTAGTGSEVTQYAVVTLHDKGTKSAISQLIFADVSFLDPGYMATLSPTVTNNTAIDALSHLLESYMAVRSSYLSEKMVEMGLSIFRECMPALLKKEYTDEDREKLMLASAIAGACIAQTSTSLPHGFGYFLTYDKGIPHGRANGLLMAAYLNSFQGKEAQKVEKMLQCMGLSSVQQLNEFLQAVLDTPESFSAEDVKNFTQKAMQYPERFASYPYVLTEDAVYQMYAKSLLR